MSFKDVRKKLSEIHEGPAISHACPAYGCPNAASMSFGNGWACYRHAKAIHETWPQVTTEIRQGWPSTCNWCHPDKLAHEEARRRGVVAK